MKIVVTAPYMLPELERFRARLEAHGLDVIAPAVAERLSEEELLQWVPDADGFICGDDRFSERVLAAAPRLKVISK
ncbi:MAG: dihydrofolate reductase, partial [Proteobacteria bacterium]|nr:dihydrofolate reductase [Pseudomonadota bacterium]